MEVQKEVVKPSVWNLLERKIAPLWVNDDREDVILAKIQQEEAEERELAKATRELARQTDKLWNVGHDLMNVRQTFKTVKGPNLIRVWFLSYFGLSQGQHYWVPLPFIL